MKEKHGCRGRNPQAGEPITLPPGKVVTFKCSNVLRAAIDGAEQRIKLLSIETCNDDIIERYIELEAEYASFSINKGSSAM